MINKHGEKVLSDLRKQYPKKSVRDIKAMFYALQVEGKGGKGKKRWETGRGTGKLDKAIKTHAKRKGRKIKKGTLI